MSTYRKKLIEVALPLDAINHARAALFGLERFYVHVSEAAARHETVQELAAAVLDVKAKLMNVSEAAAGREP